MSSTPDLVQGHSVNDGKKCVFTQTTELIDPIEYPILFCIDKVYYFHSLARGYDER